jgi:hypothetical protein
MRIAVIAMFVATVSCATPPILVPNDNPNGCRLNEVTCVGADYQATGYCCPRSFICGGPFPNVGCGVPGACCFEGDGMGTNSQVPVEQRKADRP